MNSGSEKSWLLTLSFAVLLIHGVFLTIKSAIEWDARATPTATTATPAPTDIATMFFFYAAVFLWLISIAAQAVSYCSASNQNVDTALGILKGCIMSFSVACLLSAATTFNAETTPTGYEQNYGVNMTRLRGANNATYSPPNYGNFFSDPTFATGVIFYAFGLVCVLVSFLSWAFTDHGFIWAFRVKGGEYGIFAWSVLATAFLTMGVTLANHTLLELVRPTFWGGVGQEKIDQKHHAAMLGLIAWPLLSIAYALNVALLVGTFWYTKPYVRCGMCRFTASSLDEGLGKAGMAVTSAAKKVERAFTGG